MPTKELNAIYSGAVLIAFTAASMVQADSSLPVVSDVDAAYLMDLATRAVVASARDQPLPKMTYVPNTLKEIQARVAVTLRRGGYQRGRAISQPASVTAACIDAGRLVGTGLASRDREALADPDAFVTELEILTDLEQVRGGLHDLVGLKQAIVVGRDGLAMRYRGREVLLCPSEFLANQWSLGLGIRRLVSRMDLTYRDWKNYAGNLTFFRFRTIHLVSQPDGKAPLRLHRGLRIIGENDVTRKSIEEAVHGLGRYLIYRQNPQGVFAYDYSPAKDAYRPEDNWTHQALALWAVSRYAHFANDTKASHAADLGIKSFTPLLAGLKKRPELRYIATPDRNHRLSVSALYLLSLMDHPKRKDHDLAIKQLLAGILFQQTPEGRLLEVFPPATLDPIRKGDAGQGLYALARGAIEFGAAPLMQAMEQSLPYYMNQHDKVPLARMIPWYSMAYSLMAESTGERKYVDFVFAMTDQLASRQLTVRNNDLPERLGGVPLSDPESVDYRTADYLMGFSAALRLARGVDAAPRARRYEQLVRRAVRFVMQLQFREEECFYVRSRLDTVGGIRQSLTNHSLRIDQTAAGLLGLLEALDVLYPDSKVN